RLWRRGGLGKGGNGSGQKDQGG
ncbi:MAG: hypothetical protein RIS85_1702, partial [Pseudomonadota bacterium]